MSARGSLEDIFESATNPKLRFEGKEIPRGSPAFQLVVTDVVGKNKEDETQSDNEEDKAEKPKRQYHGRRRNTVAHLYHGEPPEWTSLLANARRMSVLPEIGELAAEEDSRGRRRSSLCPPTNRSRSLSPMTMDVLRRNSVAFGSSKERETVLITLRFLTKGDYLSEVADLHGVSIPSASRILHSFCPALCRQLNNINFPTTADELRRVKDVFYKIAHFPNVDGIHGYQYRACLEMTSPIFISPAARGIPPSTMAKSRAEIQKAYRERQKAKGPAFLQKERQRAQSNYVPASSMNKRKLTERNHKAKLRNR
uniref:Uncharacterized protein n=1 Tax=Magallana gigas TaxID=29159 RepID=K1RJW1_MAGGI